MTVAPDSGGFADFIHRFTLQDWILLRKVVRRVHLRHYPDDLVTDLECDRVIASLTPRVLEALLKTAVDRGLRG